MDLLDALLDSNDPANTDALASLCSDLADEFFLLPIDAPASAAPSSSPSSPQSTTSATDFSATDLSSLPLTGDLPLPLFDSEQLDGVNDHLFALPVDTAAPNLPPRITCPDCARPFNARQDMLRHHKLMHEATPAAFACEECGKAFKLSSDLKRHFGSHLTERPFACHCGAAFKLRTQLQRHALVHSEERGHACDECGKSFKERAALTRHTATHTDARPFGCECGMAFKQLVHLQSHQRRGTCGRVPVPV